MTDSSPDKSQKAEPKDKPQPQVPVAAIGAARAEKREAEKSAEEANTKLQGQPDIDAVIAAVTAEAMRAVETRVAPLQERAAKAELALQLGLSPEQVVITVDRHANTSAASVPLALDLAVRDGRIKQGDVVVLEAMGGGFTWGACLLTM